MAMALLYNGDDSQRIQDCYQAARSRMSNNDRQNIDACWNSGLNTWNSSANLVYSAGPPEVWDAICLNQDGTPKLWLCDKQTHKIVINGNWARSVAGYGAVQNQPIHKAGFVGLLKVMGAADTDTQRGNWIIALADDINNTAIEPLP